MLVRYTCPRCQSAQRQVVLPGAELKCTACDWVRATSDTDFAGSHPSHCLACGCTDLWRQKDFPQKLGIAMVALGALGSTLAIAWYLPGIALAILLFFAFVDLLLYTLMPDVLVCYRCQSRFRVLDPRTDYPRFNLETAERYRQEAARVAEARTASAQSGR